MSETLSIRLPAEEKEQWERAAAQVQEGVAEFVRKAVRQRVESAAVSPWEKHFGSVDVAPPPPNNANIRRAFKDGKQSRKQ